MFQQEYEEDLAKAIVTYLGLAIGKVEDRSSGLCVWAVTHENIVSPVSNGRLPMNWDFPETNPLVDTSGSWSSALEYISSFAQSRIGKDT
jgi:putative DNA methylase